MFGNQPTFGVPNRGSKKVYNAGFNHGSLASRLINVGRAKQFVYDSLRTRVFLGGKGCGYDKSSFTDSSPTRREQR